MTTGIKDLKAYFTDLGLFDRERLALHCERNLVRMGVSKELPHLAILHYNELALFGREWTDFALACRGVVVDFARARLLALPFRKFFNLGEPAGPSFDAARAAGPFTVTEKLDGSMGIAFFDAKTDAFRITTKGSLDSEHGKWATERFPAPLRDSDLIGRLTLMFEIVCSEFQIVVNYAKKGYAEGLYLIGVRENETGRLWTPEEVRAFAEEHGLPTYKTYAFDSLDAVIDEAKGLPFSDEGFVIRFVDAGELMVKVKSPAYLRVHRLLSSLSDKHLLECLAAGQDMDILDSLGEVAEEYRDEVAASLDAHTKKADALLADLRGHFDRAPKEDRKTFALHVQEKVPKPLLSFLFGLLDGKSVDRKEIYEHFLKTRQYKDDGNSGFSRLPEA